MIRAKGKKSKRNCRRGNPETKKPFSQKKSKCSKFLHAAFILPLYPVLSNREGGMQRRERTGIRQPSSCEILFLSLKKTTPGLSTRASRLFWLSYQPPSLGWEISIPLLEPTKDPLVLSSLPFSDTPWQKALAPHMSDIIQAFAFGADACFIFESDGTYFRFLSQLRYLKPIFCIFCSSPSSRCHSGSRRLSCRETPRARRKTAPRRLRPGL